MGLANYTITDMVYRHTKARRQTHVQFVHTESLKQLLSGKIGIKNMHIVMG